MSENEPHGDQNQRETKESAVLGPGATFRLSAMNGAAKMLGLLGFGGLSALGSGLGRLMWHVLPSRRRLATHNIMSHLNLPEDQAAALAATSFRHSARSFVELLLTDRFGRHSPRLHFSRPDLWEGMLNTTRPIVATTGHLGAWEMLSSILGEMYPPPRPCMVVVRRNNDPAMQTFITTRREMRGAVMIGHRAVASAVLRALHHNGVVAFLVDHNALRNEALFLPFLGEEAAVNMGPALLAVRAHAEIWPAFLLRDGKNYVYEQHEPLDTTTMTGTREEKVKKAALFYTRSVERAIREHPEQWFWMHNRWKTRPLPGTETPRP